MNPEVCVTVDVVLLRQQRDHLLTLDTNEHLEGLINLLDQMLDTAEGYPKPIKEQ